MPRPRLLAKTVAIFAAAALAGCGGGGRTGSADGEVGDNPLVVVTTSILGDVVADLVGDRAEVTVLMGPGVDPHDFQISAQQAAQVREADAVISNGAGFEQGLVDTLDAAEEDGVASFEAIGAVEALELAGQAPGDQPDGGVDPHFFTDPDRMADAAEGITSFLTASVPVLDDDRFRTAAAAAVDDLRALASDVEDVLSVIPDDDRVLVTNHEVFGYFADRYDFEVVGTVIPGGGTGAEPSGRTLDALARRIEDEDVPAIFADVSSPTALSEALADEVGEVEVIALYSESLGDEGGEADTYAGMVGANAEAIAGALD